MIDAAQHWNFYPTRAGCRRGPVRHRGFFGCSRPLWSRTHVLCKTFVLPSQEIMQMRLIECSQRKDYVCYKKWVLNMYVSGISIISSFYHSLLL